MHEESVPMAQHVLLGPASQYYHIRDYIAT